MKKTTIISLLCRHLRRVIFVLLVVVEFTNAFPLHPTIAEHQRLLQMRTSVFTLTASLQTSAKHRLFRSGNNLLRRKTIISSCVSAFLPSSSMEEITTDSYPRKEMEVALPSSGTPLQSMPAIATDHLMNRRRSSRKRTRTKLFLSLENDNDNDKNDPTIDDSHSNPETNVSETKTPSRRNPKTRSNKVVRTLTFPNENQPTPQPKRATKQRSPPNSPTKRHRLRSQDLELINPQNPWIDLQIPPTELRPSATLTTGQCFNWIPVESSSKKQSAWGTHDATEWVGPISNRVYSIRETPTTTLLRLLHGPPTDYRTFAQEYFQLDVPLRPLYETWSLRDERLAKIANVLPGVRIVRQDPWECLISFICSSNNNIPRITLMLSRLRERYGTKLVELPTTEMDERGQVEVVAGEPLELYSFPDLDALKTATQEELREMGLGYRAKYVIETRDALMESGGEEFLYGLRDKNSDYVQEQLLRFSGIGRKVADCIALFSLNQTDAIPVDVHVQHIASRDYDPTVLGSAKSLTPKIYKRVGDLFRERFGRYAGWAHSLLFVAELPSFREVLPEDVLMQMDEWKQKEMAKKAAEKEAKAAKKKIQSPSTTKKVNQIRN